MEISCFFNILTSEEEIKKTIPFTIALKTKKVLNNKFNLGRERSVHWKLQGIDDRN